MAGVPSGSGSEGIRGFAPAQDIDHVLEHLEAHAVDDIALCLEEAKHLTAEPSVDLLVDFCSATRMAWASLYRLYICCMEECPQHLLKELLFAIDVGMVGANDVLSSEYSQGSVARCKQATTYLESISLRRDLLSILASRGVDAVNRRLAELSANVHHPGPELD